MSYELSQSRLYIWNRCFFKQDQSLIIDRVEAPYRRLSVTVIIAGHKPFYALDENNQMVAYEGVILGPNFKRNNIQAQNSQLTVLDAFITSPVYWDLMALVGNNKKRVLRQEELDKVQPLCRDSFGGELTLQQSKALFEAVIYALCDRGSLFSMIDSRIKKILSFVEQHPANEVSVRTLANEACLSESRLRSLFSQEMKCTLSQYIRSVSVWKTLPLLEQGMSLTEAAYEAGFHDLAHYSRAVSEVAGLPPSQIFKSGNISINIEKQDSNTDYKA